MPEVYKSAVRQFVRVLAGLAVLGLAAASLWHGVLAAKSDADSLRARWLINQWRDNTGPVVNLALWQQAIEELQAAVQLTPDNAQLWDDLGFLFGERAVGLGTPDADSEDYELQQALLVSALDNYRMATKLRPTFPYAWANLAQVKHLKGETDAELWTAYDKAVRYGRNEPGVQVLLARVAFAQWETLSTVRKKQISDMIEEARPGPRHDLYQVGEHNGVVLLNM